MSGSTAESAEPAAAGAPVPSEPVAELSNITRLYRMGEEEVHALDGFSFTFRKHSSHKGIIRSIYFKRFARISS